MTRATIEPGEEITQDALGVSDADWEELIELGAVREEEYPDIPPDTSPAEYERAKAAAESEVAEAREVLLQYGEEGQEAADQAAPAPKQAAATPTPTTPKPADTENK
jgi:hypothetical protein